MASRGLPLGLVRYRPGIFEKFKAPGSGVISASGVPALFGESRYDSRYSYLAHVSGKAPKHVDQDSPVLARGRILEKVMPELIIDQCKLDWVKNIEGVRAYAKHPVIPNLIASPDAVVTARDGSLGIGEWKTVDGGVWQRMWIDGPPLDVQLQVQTALACCTNATFGLIGCLTVNARPFTLEALAYRVERNEEVINLIEKQVEEDLALLAEGKLPPPDTSTHSARALQSIYPRVDPGMPPVQVNDEEAIRLVSRWHEAAQEADKAKKDIEKAKAYLQTFNPQASLFRIGNQFEVKVTSVSVAEHLVRASVQRRVALRDLGS